MPAGPFSMLELDHRHVEHLLEELGDSEPGAERERAVHELEESLAAHMQFEESNVYPLVVTEIDAESAEEAEIEQGGRFARGASGRHQGAARHACR